MNIGLLAKKANVGIDTIRYYEKLGILPKPKRLGSGYRCYGDADVARLNFIQRTKLLGFSLAEISALLMLSNNTQSDMSKVKKTVHQHLQTVLNKQIELEKIRLGLEALLDKCPGQGEVKSCPIIAEFTKE